MMDGVQKRKSVIDHLEQALALADELAEETTAYLIDLRSRLGAREAADRHCE